MNKIKLLFSSYFLAIIGLFIYSFTQVDLSLTLSKVSVYQNLEKSLQYVGFFQRPLSTNIFIVLMSVLFICYFLFIYLTLKKKIGLGSIKILIFLTFLSLVFSYNAFSYDLFNYIFDAKIFTFYHQNPYLHKPLDFSSDPMLHFMRWTHRLYPYGPSWLILTVPLSYIGLNLFLPTFFLFKLLMGFSFLGSCYLIYKISEKIFPENKLLNVVFFAFNPLVIIESLVSAHNDIPMVFFFLLSIYLLIIRKKFLGLVSYLFSVGVKFTTASVLPVAILLLYLERTKRKIEWENLFLLSISLVLLADLFASFRTTFQPWYLITPLALASFLPRKFYVLIPSVVATIFSVFIYIPYVFMTDYAIGYPRVIQNIELVGVAFSILLPLAYFVYKKFILKQVD